MHENLFRETIFPSAPSNTFGGGYSPVPHAYRSSTITKKYINSLVYGILHVEGLWSLKSQNDSEHINAWILKRAMSKGF